MRFALVTELEGDISKRRCAMRPSARRRTSESEPDNAKGRNDGGVTKNGAITCGDGVTKSGAITCGDGVTKAGAITCGDGVTKAGAITCGDGVTNNGGITC